MKRLLIALGLFGIFGGALAQNFSSVTFTVGTYTNVTFTTAIPALAIPGGGFGGPYTTLDGVYTVSANVGWFITPTMAPLFPPVPNSSAGWTWSTTGSLLAGGGGVFAGNTANVTLTGGGGPGQFLSPLDSPISGTATFTITP